MSDLRSKYRIPAEVHAARLDEMERIMGAIRDDVSEWTGTTAEISQIKIKDRDGKGTASRTVFAVWFLPGVSNDGHPGVINHGMDFSIDMENGPCGIKIKTWGTGYTASARLTFPDHNDGTPAEIATFWEQVDDTARAIMHPAFKVESS